MPRPNILAGVSPVMALPSKRISPVSTRSYPVITLNRVVLPDPFGPINPVIVPCSTTSEQSSSAWIPPKALETACTSKMLIVLSLFPIYQGWSFLRRGAHPSTLETGSFPGQPPALQRLHNASRHNKENCQKGRAGHDKMLAT